MSDIFLKTVNMSISSTYLVLAVVLLRFLLKKAPKWVNVLLWGLVAVRLLCPFTLESALSLIPSAETISPDIMMDPTPTIHTGIEAVNSVVNPIIEESFAPAPAASANPLQIWIPVLSVVWVIGMALMGLYTFISYQHLRRQVKMAIRVKDNVYLSENVSSPFVLGVFRPRIYLPYHMDEIDQFHVLAHERTHIRRKDHWWKPLGFLLLTIHWFNPFLWVAYILLCRDIELACDEKVVQNMRPDQRANYSQALLNCSISRRSIAACPIAFGEVGVKERVKNVLSYKKPGFWVVLIALILCAVVAVCFLTDPVENTPALSLAELELSGIQAIKLTNAHNGETTYLSDSNQIDAVCNFLKTISGSNGSTSKGIYEGSYSLSLTTDSGEEIHIGFGDTNHFFYGEYGDGYPVMYDLENMDISDVISFFRQYDISYPVDLATTTVNISPYSITSTLSADGLSGHADYLTSGGGYNFFDYMDEEIVAILNSLTENDFVLSRGITPDTTITLSKGDLEIILNSDGEYVEFSFDTDTSSQVASGIWAVKNEELNAFFTMMNSYSPENSTYEIYNVAPLEELPRSYNLEEATIDKVVIMQDGDVSIYNQDVWEEFLEYCSFNIEHTVRIMHYTSTTENSESSYTIYDLTYKGGSYSLRWFEDGVEHTESYLYLRHFADTMDGSASYDAYDLYVLTDNSTATWEDIWNSLTSSLSGVGIDFFIAYSDLIYYPDQPDIPSELTSVALMDGSNVIATVTDSAQLDNLYTMIARAQALGYEPKTYDLGLKLVFTSASGETLTVTLDWLNDLCCIDGVFYDYGPGYTDVGGIDARAELFQLLGVTYSDPAELSRVLDTIGAQQEPERMESFLELIKK